MLSRSNLFQTGRSSDSKCLANRRLLEIGHRSNQHGSDKSITLVELAKRTRKSVDSLSFQQRPRLPRTSSRVLENGESHLQRAQSGSAAPTKALAEPRIAIASSSIYNEKSSDALLWKSAKKISLSCVQTTECQRSGELKFLENVEACFSRSVTLVQPDNEETASELSPSHELPARGSSTVRQAEVGSGVDTTWVKILKKKKEARRIRSLMLLNALAAVYGSSNVANRFVADAAPALPASLTSLVRFSSALIFFIPALVSAVRNREIALLRAGAELGGLAFAASFVDSCNPGASSSSSPSILFAFTVIFVPLMELFAGRQSGPKLTRLATISAAILGMGVLEEEGFGWKVVSCPQISDIWGAAVAAMSALHIFRSEAHGERFDPLRLNAVQFGVLTILSLGWELCTTFDASALQSHLNVETLQCIPWIPLLYNGLVCSGLCSWLELRGLRSVHASTATMVYTTIPVWGAFLSALASEDVPADSAILGGLVIVFTSIYAQIISKDDHSQEEGEATSSPSNSIENIAPAKHEVKAESISQSAKDASVGAGSYFPAGLLTSQLKYPYYAAQAKRLLAEIKFKLGALKSLGLVFTGVTTSSLKPDANNNATTGPIGQANNLTAAHIGPNTPDVSIHISHGPMSVSQDFAHGASSVLAHTATEIISGLEAALIVVGSDLMLAIEGAEDFATVLERLLQGGAEKAVEAVAACLTVGSGLTLGADLHTNFEASPQTMQEAANFVDTAAPCIAQSFDTQVDAVVNTPPFDLAHLADSLIYGINHVILPLIDHVKV